MPYQRKKTQTFNSRAQLEEHRWFKLTSVYNDSKKVLTCAKSEGEEKFSLTQSQIDKDSHTLTDINYVFSLNYYSHFSELATRRHPS